VARGRKKNTRRNYKRGAAAVPVPANAQEENKPARGVKLKTVSAFTMLFALACLAAFMAGRPPVSAAGSAPDRAALQKNVNERPLRHDNPRRLLGRFLGKREPGAKRAEKSARARTPIRFLPANAEQKYQQAENI